MVEQLFMVKSRILFLACLIPLSTVFACANNQTSLDNAKNDPPKISVNGINDSRFRYSNNHYADGREIGCSCSIDANGNESCAIPAYSQGPFQNVKVISSYESVLQKDGRFFISVTYVSAYSLWAEIGFLDEEGKPLEAEDGQWLKYNPIYMEFGHFYGREIKESAFELGTLEKQGKTSYVVIHLTFAADTYGSADFLFFTRP